MQSKNGHISFVPLSNAIGVGIMELGLNHPLSFHYDDYENDWRLELMNNCMRSRGLTTRCGRNRSGL